MSSDPNSTRGPGDPSQPSYGEPSPPPFGAGAGPTEPTTPIYDAPPAQPGPSFGAPSYGPPSYTPPPPQAPPPPAAVPPGSAYPSYGQQPYPQYAQPGMAPYGGYAGLEHPKGTLVLVLGILSIAVCQILGPFAWVQGRKALAEIDTSGQNYSNRGQVQAGMICGIVGSVLLILGVLYFVFIIVMVIAAGTSTATR